MGRIGGICPILTFPSGRRDYLVPPRASPSIGEGTFEIETKS